MSLTRLASRIPSTAAWVVSHPVESTSRAVGFARGVVVSGVGLAKVARQPATEPPARAPRPAAAPDADERPTAPAPPDPFQDREPPVDVVGQALAAEEEGPSFVGGPTTEPHPVTRDEVHGEAPLVREERDEIDEETAEGLGLDEDQPAT